MPLKHIGLLTLRPETTAETADEILSGLRALRDQVPGVVSVTAARDLFLKDGNADICFEVSFADEAAWRSYQVHPAHVALVRDHIAPAISAKAFIQVGC
ncbi:Dabb family protein [Arthrobacter sp. 7Tela_A1]|uniref:Dabb family protein n=1 Tax=Arthrobacter sp. 7Tela_A1 TaxID=3093745 RepID=UPI003BB587A0